MKVEVTVDTEDILESLDAGQLRELISDAIIVLHLNKGITSYEILSGVINDIKEYLS